MSAAMIFNATLVIAGLLNNTPPLPPPPPTKKKCDNLHTKWFNKPESEWMMMI